MKPLVIVILFLSLTLNPLFPDEPGAPETVETSSGGTPSDAALSGGTSSDAAGKKSVEEQRLETIRYGTENEIAALIQTLKTENAVYLDDELVTLVQGTLNQNILTGVFTFFGDRSKEGLEGRALKAVTEWDGEANETITSAIEYLGKIKNRDCIKPLKALLSTEERRFNNNIFRALGKIAGGHEDIRDETASYLVEYYTDKIPSDEARREIVSALGESGSPEAVSFLIDIAGNNDERTTIRMAAVDSLSKIGDLKGLPAILAGVSSQDPNLRSASVAALGPFNGQEVDHAILEAFRDTYYRTRIGAAQSAGKRKLTSAIPYLAYRAAHDDVPAVKDEAIRALGAITDGESVTILDSLFSDRKTPDRVRILSAEILIRERPDDFTAKVIAEMDDAKKRNQTPLYNGLIKAVSTAKTNSVESLARRFLASGGVIEKSYALDIVTANRFTSLSRDVESLLDQKNTSLIRKAQATLAVLRGSND
jgi:HEAT repeat protein